MYSWRITKYDPLKRDADGSYLDNEEWTCFSEVGTKVSMEEYQITEEKYLNAVTTFMAEMGLNKVYVMALEQWSDEVRTQNANEFSIKDLGRESCDCTGSSSVSQINITECYLV